VNTLKLELPVPASREDLPGELPGKVLIDPRTGSLIVRRRLSSDDFANLRGLAPSDHLWQDRLDRLALELDEFSGLFPPTLWGEHLKQLQAGDANAWTLFVQRYAPAIAATIRNLLRSASSLDADDLAAEFITWLYLPPRNGIRAGQRLAGLQLTDATGRRIHRFRGWLCSTLRRWLRRSAGTTRRLAQLSNELSEVVADRRASHLPLDQQIDRALLFHAADMALEEIRELYPMLHRALIDLLGNETLSATTEWLRDENLAASPQSAQRARRKAATLFRSRLIEIYRGQFGGDETDLPAHLDALAEHLSRVRMY
jgi:hypothetical protein